MTNLFVLIDTNKSILRMNKMQVLIRLFLFIMAVTVKLAKCLK